MGPGRKSPKTGVNPPKQVCDIDWIDDTIIIRKARRDQLNVNTTNIKSNLYNFCGSFDPLAEKSSQLGLFFMSKEDAELYLNEIARFDPEGTKMLGLSIHCFGLDFAYRVMRDYHPKIDFRFVPDLNEIKKLLTSNNSNIICGSDWILHEK